MCKQIRRRFERNRKNKLWALILVQKQVKVLVSSTQVHVVVCVYVCKRKH